MNLQELKRRNDDFGLIAHGHYGMGLSLTTPLERTIEIYIERFNNIISSQLHNN